MWRVDGCGTTMRLPLLDDARPRQNSLNSCGGRNCQAGRIVGRPVVRLACPVCPWSSGALGGGESDLVLLALEDHPGIGDLDGEGFIQHSHHPVGLVRWGVTAHR